MSDNNDAFAHLQTPDELFATLVRVWADELNLADSLCRNFMAQREREVVRVGGMI